MRESEEVAPKKRSFGPSVVLRAVSAKQYAGAEVDFRRALELNPDSPENYRNLSSLLREVNRSNEVDALLQQGMRGHPKSLDFIFLLADSYVREGV